MDLHEKHFFWAVLPTEWINFNISLLKKIEMVICGNLCCSTTFGKVQKKSELCEPSDVRAVHHCQ